MKEIEVNKSIFDANDKDAAENRKLFLDKGIKAVNMLASPGAGKTSVIIKLLEALPEGGLKGVIEGDVASSIDTDKILSLGWQAVQINTDGGCHLTSQMVSEALKKLDLSKSGYLFIENIGNLICPAEFDLGETLRVIISSVPEGDDKPLKYPYIFKVADLVVLNKTDLLGRVEFSMERFVKGVRAVNGKAKILNVSCRTGEGVETLVESLKVESRKNPN